MWLSIFILTPPIAHFYLIVHCRHNLGQPNSTSYSKGNSKPYFNPTRKYMEDNLNFVEYGRGPPFFFKWETNSILTQLEEV